MCRNTSSLFKECKGGVHPFLGSLLAKSSSVCVPVYFEFSEFHLLVSTRWWVPLHSDSSVVSSKREGESTFYSLTECSFYQRSKWGAVLHGKAQRLELNLTFQWQ